MKGLNEIKNNLKKYHFSAAGPNGITYPIIKYLSRTLLKSFSVFIIEFSENMYSLLLSTIPLLFLFQSLAKIQPIQKIITQSPSQAAFVKFLKKWWIIVWFLFLEKKKLISLCQSGFRSGCSTIDNILILKTNVHINNLRWNHLVSVFFFFNIEKVYDKTWHSGILRDL